jgi:hypothetical protein
VKLDNFFAELKRRNVYKVAVAYAVVAWLLMQMTAAWAGEKELALQQLEARVRGPVEGNMLSYRALKLLPFWDPLRGDPRFEKIVQSLAPK